MAPRASRKKADDADDSAAAASVTAAAATARPKRGAAGKKAAEEPAPAPAAAAAAAPAAAKRGRGKKAAAAAADDADDDDKKDDAMAATTTATATTTSSNKRKADDDAPAAAAAAPAEPKKARGRGGKAAAKKEADDDEDDKKDAAAAATSSSSAAAAAETKTAKTVVMKGKAPVDANCPVAKTTHVYSQGADVFDVTLNQTDVTYNVKGHNKFYIIQLLESDDNKQYYCWTRWGRVGADGQSALQGPSTAAMAMVNFTSKFQDKTKNRWENRHAFVHHSGKYDLVHVDYSSTDPEPVASSASADSKPKETPKSKLDVRLQSLMELIFNVKAMEEAVLEMNYDTKKAPLGKLSKDQVKHGYEALQELERLVKANITHGRDIDEWTNKFYTRIPHDFGMRRPPTINSIALIQEKVKLLEALGEIEIAMKTIKSTSDGSNPVDSHYDNLKCDLKPIDKDSDEFKLVQDYVKKTHGTTHNAYSLSVVDVFNVDRLGETARFRKDIGNHQLLWHGSRTTNYCGILSQGLRIAPPEAPVTGYMFGKGLYFADIVSKSANYCFTNRANNTGLMLLCEVALGEAQELNRAKYDAHLLPPGKLHTKGLGKTIPDPTDFTHIDGGGVKVPYGKPVQSTQPEAAQSSLLYNEYITYDVNNVRMRYLLRVKFEYK